MAINIYLRDSEYPDGQVAFLCDNDWELPIQVEALKSWLASNAPNIERGSLVADIGFKVRADSSGGGAVIDSQMIKALSEHRMEIFLSEYH